MSEGELEILEVRCDCGNRAKVFRCDLTSGAITSCGHCEHPTDKVIDLAPFCPDCGGAIIRDGNHCH